MADTDPSSGASANEDLPILTPAEIERRVVGYLNGSPRATRDQWRRLGAHGMRWLYTIAVSEAQGTRANRLRAAALATVGQLAGATKLDALLDVVADPESSVIVRCGAIEGMGHAGLNRALPVLQTQAYHPDFKVRLYTCTALGRIGTAGAARIVRDIAGRDPHSQVRRAAQVELGRLETKAATRKTAVGE